MASKLRLIIFFLLLSACASKQASNVGSEPEQSHGREEIRKVIRSQVPGIRKCYEAELKNSPDLEGQLVIRLEVVDGGVVNSVQTLEKSTLNNKKVENCVADLIRKAKFPAPEKGTIAIIDYPFVFAKNLPPSK